MGKKKRAFQYSWQNVPCQSIARRAFLSQVLYILGLFSKFILFRILLCNVKGAESFDDLLRYNDADFATYKEACLARNLIRDDAEWIKALEEAEQIMTASSMRVFFA